MKYLTKKRVAWIMVASALLVALFCGAMADDKDGQYAVSNTLSIEDVATLALDVEDTGDELPEGATRVSITWLPDDVNAPESVTAIITGSGSPEKVVLTAENDWAKTVMLAESTVPYSVTLLNHTGYEVVAEEGSLTITVTLSEEEDEFLEVIKPGEDEDAADESEYGLKISANVNENDTLTIGMQIILTAEPVGYDDVEYTLIWQRNTGSGWEVIEGATELTYSFTLTEENASWSYRVELVPVE